MVAWLAAALYVIDLTIKIVALGVVPKNRRPSSGMAWLLLILIIPLFGFVLFLVLGRTKLEQRRHQEQAAINAMIAEQTADVPTLEAAYDGPAYVSSVATLNRTLGAKPVAPGNRIDLFPGYADSLAAMAVAIDAATSFVHVEFYISAWDDVTAPVFEALARAADRGVTVRLLFDHLGSRGIPGFEDFQKRLDTTAIEWHMMLPIQPLKGKWRRPDLRNHRKIMVVDGTVAFTGSQNLIEPGYNKPKNHKAGREWVELMARVEGPAVSALNLLFATDWYAESGVRLINEIAAPPPPRGEIEAQVIPSGPGFATENNLRAFTTLIYSAQRRLSITSPYFVPDESLLYAVTTAAQRGVDVELFVSEAGDQFMVFHAQRSYYEALLRAGVRIYFYPAPAILHSKFFTVDDDVAVLGSSNMDMRSFALNYEVSLMLLGSDAVAKVTAVEDSYRAVSHELTLDEWLNRPRRSAYIDNVMRLTAALQ
ncbi:cardiolipin synthase [Mumia zhuanghuii]|uniref:Cardiolipin synthase n=2 Tax=Mumia TaxID=1546255 RepID=A0ABW1QR74_9ACTN|nr:MULTISPECIES: cardiolipin synthase [Mumia]KAA1423903.1 cardiolipin synthase [Mumia zhuanghuii]